MVEHACPCNVGPQAVASSAPASASLLSYAESVGERASAEVAFDPPSELTFEPEEQPPTIRANKAIPIATILVTSVFMSSLPNDERSAYARPDWLLRHPRLALGGAASMRKAHMTVKKALTHNGTPAAL